MSSIEPSFGQSPIVFDSFATQIPNRVFVGGIDFKTKEDDLHKFFSNFGAVKDTKVIRDRADISKGYGFVTFESTEDAQKVRDEHENMYMQGKKLNIGPAVRKQQPPFAKEAPTSSNSANWILHPAGYASYNHSGITYFTQTQNPQSIQLQPAAAAQGTMMTYNGNVAAYQPVPATHYAAPGSIFASYGNQPYNAVQMPVNQAPIGAGSCGQLVASTTGHSNVDQVNLLPMSSPQGISVAGTSANIAQAHNPGVLISRPPMPPQSFRMILPGSASGSYVTQLQQPQFINPSMYAQTANAVRYGLPQPAQYFDSSALAPYGNILVPPEMTDAHHTIMSSENDLSSPPITPDKSQ